MNRALAAYARLSEHPGKYRIVRWLGRWAFPADGLVLTVDRGIRMHLHPRDWIEYQMLRGNLHEPHTLEFLFKNLGPGDHALLTGVNNGMHVIAAAQAVGPGGCVIGVEPQPAALLRARANIDLNGMAGRVRLIAAAVGSGADLAPMPWSSVENSGAASLLDSGPGFVVPLLPLSSVIESACRGMLRLILLDVQGYEVPALKGLRASCLPEVMIVEDSAEWLDKAGSSRAELHGQMCALGYQLHDLMGRDHHRRRPTAAGGEPCGRSPGCCRDMAGTERGTAL